MIITLLYTLLIIPIIYIITIQALSAMINKKVLIVSFCIATLMYMLLFFMLTAQDFKVILTLSSVIIAVIICNISIQGCSKKQVVYFTSLVLGVILTVETSTQLIITIATNDTIYPRMIDLLVISILLVICIITAKNGVFVRVSRSIVLLRKLMKAILLFSVWLSSVLVSILSFFFHEYSELPGFSIIITISVALVILFGLMCPLLIVINLSNQHYRKITLLTDEQMQVQAEHYKMMSEKNEDIRRFKHNYKNLQVGLTDALLRSDINGALAILETDEVSLWKTNDLYKTGSVVLDALLNEKQLSASKINANIKFDGVLPGNILSAVDTCVIFGNALDNAIEACAKISFTDEKVITVASIYKNNFLLIKIDNPTASDVQIINNTVLTTKLDKKDHGIGLHSIRTTVEKNLGEISLSYRDGIFSLEIDFDFNIRR